MFNHAYGSYMTHAYPLDELKPLSCVGRRWDRRERGTLDDTLGGFALTLVDSLDTLALMGHRKEFAEARRCNAMAWWWCRTRDGVPPRRLSVLAPTTPLRPARAALPPPGTGD